jgi:hypothetical protein
MTSSTGTRPAPKLPDGPRAALVVAIGSYNDPALTRLRSTAHDAEEMANVLANPDIGSFQVTSVVDRTAQEIRLAVEDFLEGRGPADLVVVYMSCHGLLDRQDRLYFAATDTRKDRLAATAVEASWLWDRLEECRSNCQVVILDCCNSGAFGRAGGKGEADTDLRLSERFVTQGRGRAILTASRANQRSWEGAAAGEAGSSSVFTNALAEGLQTGAADLDGDGYVSVEEAYKYAYRKVIESNAGQIPQHSISGGEGNMLLTRNPAGLIIIPAPLTEDIRAALDSPNPDIRVGAVNALGNWLSGPDAARALRADEVLRRIVANEVFVVANAARAYLDALDVPESTKDKTEAATENPAAKAAEGKVEAATEPPASKAEGSKEEAASEPQAGDPAPRTLQKASSGAARLLDAGYIILSIPLCIIALDILIPRKTFLPWPWWAIFAVSILGITVTLGTVRQYAVPASILLWGMAWYAVYSLSVVGTSHSSYSTAIAVLSTECIIAAVVSFAVCIWIVVLLPRGIRNVNISLAIGMGFFSVALVLAAIALHTGKVQGGIWNAVAVTTIAAALGILLALMRVHRPVTAGS